MQIFIHYRITNRPWGGGNSFLKGFEAYCLKNGIKLARSINSNYDVLFFNAAHAAPGRLLDLSALLDQKFCGRSGGLKKFYRRRQPKRLVYRADGFRVLYANMGRNKSDCVQAGCLQIADHVIFQNEFTLRIARSRDVGFLKNNYSIIHNGVNQQLFRFKQSGFWDGKRKLRVFCCNWSKNLNKGYRELAQFSQLPGVEVYFCGNWPTHQIDAQNVTLIPPKPQKELALEYPKYDVFLHVSKYDSCPNVCLEALSCGLPIIYHATSGIEEVAGDCGIKYSDHNPEETLEKIRCKYDRLIENIFTRRSYFSMERCGREYLDVFKAVL